MAINKLAEYFSSLYTTQHRKFPRIKGRAGVSYNPGMDQSAIRFDAHYSTLLQELFNDYYKS